MTDQEINQAIAESVGWENCACGFGTETRYKETPSEVRVTVPYPNYCNSYDAIMPVVKALNGMQRNRFADHLFKAVFPDHYVKGWMFTHMMHEYITATPRQLCEAYLAVGGADA